MSQFETVIIGGGPAGLGLAYPLQAAGQKVAVVEENKWGGTCPNRGCDPKKVLLGPVEILRRNQYLLGKGIVNQVQINWADLMAFKNTFTDPVSTNSRAGLVAAGITVFDGHASFKDNHTLDIDGETITADRFVIATGQRPRQLAITGGELLGTSTTFMQLPQLPAEIAFVGAGFEAFEFAAIASAAGAKVHIIQHNDRPLKQFPQAGVAELMHQLIAQGVEFHLNFETQTIQPTETGIMISGSDAGKLQQLTVNAGFATSGRIPNCDTLNLTAIGVATDSHGIKVNDHLQTNTANIYAMGDVVSRRQPKLTPVASFEAQYLSRELLHSGAAIAYPMIPSVIYGMPRLAQVGVSLTEAKANDAYVVKPLDMTQWFTYRHLNEAVAKATTIVDKTTDRIMGAFVISNEADELINYLTQIIDQQLTMKQVQQEILLYPTVASDLGYLG